GTPSAASRLISAQSSKVITLQSSSVHFSPPQLSSFQPPPTPRSFLRPSTHFRTTASPSGDGGRDGELYAVEDESTVMFQFSVTTEWRSKINQQRGWVV
ncbi:hypothetical protein, partial [Herbiconiux sp.]|uniref:hypothetical protein n=1 Tax=Herbiconiux sp. TaxID=1871186 RepID=UPI0025BF8CEF